MRKVKNFLVGVGVLTLLPIALFISADSVPEMAWSQSKDRCVQVVQYGKKIPNGCERVARGELKVERYIVK